MFGTILGSLLENIIIFVCIFMTDILLREDHPQKTREYLNNIKNSGEALLTIINDILDFSNFETHP